MTDDLLSLFHAREGLICVVGAGGKKTTLYRLAEAHSGRIAITATVYTAPFRSRLQAHTVVAEPEQLEAAVAGAAAKHPRVAYALPSDKPARLRGVAPAQVAAIHQGLDFDATFVKADGARMRWLKAPNAQEPPLPGAVNVVIPVVSVRAIGQPMNAETVHRWQIAAQITGLTEGDTITAAHIARLLASPQGALKNVGEAKVVPVINMVETRAQQQLALAAAEQALALSDRIDRIVLGAMAEAQPVVAVVQR